MRRRQHPPSHQDPHQQSEAPVELLAEPSPPVVDDQLAAAMSSAGRDRTGEFALAVRSLSGAAASAPLRRQRRRPTGGAANLAAYSEFMRGARHASKGVASAYAKLERLAALAARRHALFDDRPAEIQELTYIVKADIAALNRQIAALSDGPRAGHVGRHSSNVVIALQSRLARVGEDFKRALETREENLRRQTARRDAFSQRSYEPEASAPLLLDYAAEDDRRQAMDQAGPSYAQPDRIQATVLRDRGDELALMRAQTAQSIESTVVELGGIFQRLATLVKEQDEAVTRIDANVESAELDIEAAHSQILKYFQSVSGNRALMLKIFGVLVFFFVVFAVFLA